MSRPVHVLSTVPYHGTVSYTMQVRPRLFRRASTNMNLIPLQSQVAILGHAEAGFTDDQYTP
jgi:hypothetical protein